MSEADDASLYSFGAGKTKAQVLSSENDERNDTSPGKVVKKRGHKKMVIDSESEGEVEPFESEGESDDSLELESGEESEWESGQRKKKKREEEYRDEVRGLEGCEKWVVEKILGVREEDGKTRFLIKFKDRSYVHVRWMSIVELKGIDKMAQQRVNRYYNKFGSAAGSEEEYFNPNFVIVDRVLDFDENEKMYLVKWKSQGYDMATWEKESDIIGLEESEERIKEFQERKSFNGEDLGEYNVEKSRPPLSAWTPLEQSPKFKNDNELRKYQLEGLNWLMFCYLKNQGSIIADEMGLGKTVQSVSFLDQLYRKFKIRGPFLVIAPLSTIPHWEREFKGWTDMNVVVYHGGAVARDMIVDYEFYYENETREDVYKFNVLITTFEMAIAGVGHLKQIPWRVAIIDEAHRLKSKSSKITETLKMYEMDHRILATGTPLQNRIEELWALMNFLEPQVFNSEEEFIGEFGDLKRSEDVERLQGLLKPYMLRRLKEDVEKSIPVKEETIIEVELTGPQKKYYRAILEKNFNFLTKGCKGNNMPNLMNVMMELRKCCIHPYLIKGAEERINEEARVKSYDEQFNLMIQSSGKLVLLDKLLKKLKENGHKVLIFSQMTKCLDILSDYLNGKGYKYERIDGGIRGDLRQASIDRFNKDEDSFVFLLCTRAGGVGINLTSADTVIIYDSDWNPQNDLQAQARCHRIGQTKSVKIYRLLTRNTYEREMFDKASLKLGLDKAILQKMSFEEESSKLTNKQVEALLKKGAYGLMMENEEESIKFCEEDIDQILSRRTQIIVHENSNKGSIFSKASFNDGSGINIDLEDPKFWEKWAQLANVEIPIEKEELILFEPRQRKNIMNLQNILPNEVEEEDKNDKDVILSEVSDEYSNVEEEEDYEEKKDNLKPRLWSFAERLRLEKKLMTFGFGRWDKFMDSFTFRNENDLILVSRQLIKYCLDHLSESESKLKVNFEEIVGDFIKGGDLGGEVEVEGEREREIGTVEGEVEGITHSMTQGINEGASELKSDNASTFKKIKTVKGKKLIEFRSFLKQSPLEYREHLKKRCKLIITRLFNIHLLLLRLNFKECKSFNDFSFPVIPGHVPVPWWTHTEDLALAFGICKHGYNEYETIKRDPELIFYDKFKHLISERVEEGVEVEGEGVEEGDDGDERVEEDEDMKDDEMDIDSERVTTTTAPNAVTVTDSSEFKWPSKSELGIRTRRIVVAVMREFNQEKKKINKQPKKKRNDPERWSKRDVNEFIKVATNYGFPLIKQGKRSWHMYRLLFNGFKNKSDAVFDAFFEELLPLAKEAAAKAIDKKKKVDKAEEGGEGVKVEGEDVNVKVEGEEVKQETQVDQDTTDAADTVGDEAKQKAGDEQVITPDVLTPEKARRMLKKAQLLDTVRQSIIYNPMVSTFISMMKRMAGLPDWWVPHIHDKGFLIGIARYGFQRFDLLIADKELPFYEVYFEKLSLKENVKVSHVQVQTNSILHSARPNIEISELPSVEGIKNDILVWPKDSYLVRRVEYLSDIVLKPTLTNFRSDSPNKKRKRDPKPERSFQLPNPFTSRLNNVQIPSLPMQSSNINNFPQINDANVEKDKSIFNHLNNLLQPPAQPFTLDIPQIDSSDNSTIMQKLAQLRQSSDK